MHNGCFLNALYILRPPGAGLRICRLIPRQRMVCLPSCASGKRTIQHPYHNRARGVGGRINCQLAIDNSPLLHCCRFSALHSHFASFLASYSRTLVPSYHPPTNPPTHPHTRLPSLALLFRLPYHGTGSSAEALSTPEVHHDGDRVLGKHLNNSLATALLGWSCIPGEPFFLLGARNRRCANGVGSDRGHGYCLQAVISGLATD